MSDIIIKPDNHTGKRSDNGTFVGMRLTNKTETISINDINEEEIKEAVIIKAIFPLGYRYSEDNQEKLKKELHSLLTTIKKYNKLSDIGKIKKGSKDSAFPYSAYITVINDFLRHGYYIESDIRYKHASMGKINWKRTISQCKPIIQKNSPIYTDFIIRVNEKKHDKIISQIHEWCVYDAFRKFGWMTINILPRKPVLQDSYIVSNKPYIKSVIMESLRSTFNDRNKRLFSAMLEILEEKTGNEEKEFRLGTNDFKHIWEKMIDESFGTHISDEYNPPAEWIFSNNTEPADKLEPDTIMIQQVKEKNIVVVLDAKYYSYIENGRLPSASDINKQVRYGRYASDKHPDYTTYNAFLIPYKFNKIDEIPTKYNEDRQNNKDKGKYYCIGYARMKPPKGASNIKTYENILGILVDTKWLIDNTGNIDRQDLADFINEQYGSVVNNK